MRILMTTDAVGGVFTYSLELARELCARGANVVLAVLGPPASAEQRASLETVAGLVFEECTGALEWMEEPWSDVDAAIEWLLELERKTTPDLVHLNGYAFGSAPFQAPTLVVAHSSVLGWWRAVFGEPAPPRLATYARRTRAGLERAALVVAPSRAMGQSLCDEHGFSGECVVVPNGIDQSRFARREKHEYFAAAGRLWDAAKNLELVERAAAALPWPVRVAGDDGGSPRSPAVERLGVLDRQELAAFFAEAAIFLHPARYEPFGLAPLEAASAGCALVLGDIPSLREVWGDAALYVNPDSSDELARCACSLAFDEPLRRLFAARARRRAERYSAARMADGYVALYRELVRRRGPERRLAPSNDADLPPMTQTRAHPRTEAR